jgi:hypothetical protein
MTGLEQCDHSWWSYTSIIAGTLCNTPSVGHVNEPCAVHQQLKELAMMPHCCACSLTYTCIRLPLLLLLLLIIEGA